MKYTKHKNLMSAICQSFLVEKVLNQNYQQITYLSNQKIICFL